MTSIRTTVCAVAILLLSIAANGQQSRVKEIPGLNNTFAPKLLPAARWTLTFNPFGLLEYPGAIGLGIGYRINKNVELWSETSYLFKGIVMKKDTISGVRQIFQLRYYLNDKPNYFIGVEARYKSVNHWEQTDFYNAATQDTLMSFYNRAHHYFFGMALLIGARTTVGASKRFQIEATIGLGWKSDCTTYKGIPPGYREHRFHALAIDDPFAQPIPGDYSGPYLPCTFRLVYLLGKIIRP